MKKQWLMIVLALALSVLCSVSALASPSRLADDADLLTPEEEAALIARLDEVSESYGADVVIVTAPSTEDKTPQEYADDYYDYGGYRPDGVLLLFSVEYGDWHISTSGFAIDQLSDAAIQSVGDNMLEDLRNGAYASAFHTFIDEMTYALDTSFPLFKNLLICLVIGLAVAVLITGSMRKQLKSVRPQPSAESYVKDGSLQVTDSSEFFLYRQVDRVKKESSNNQTSTHVSSSGNTHGGGGGRI